MSKDYQSGAAPSAQKSHAELIAEMNSGPTPEHRHDRKILRYYAYELDAAHKREIEATAAKCCQLGRLAGYGASEIKHQQEPVGNVAKLREALEDVLDKIDKWRTDGCLEYWQYSQLFDIADDALAAPPRNCDKYPTHRVALDVWRDADPRENPCFDEWLYKAAKKGEAAK